MPAHSASKRRVNALRSRASTSFFPYGAQQDVDGRDISAFTRLLDALCPAMTWIVRRFQQTQVLDRIDLPDLPWSQDAELLRRNTGAGNRFREREPRRIDRLVGQLECSVMVRERELSAAVAERLHGLVGIHVLIAHEPARLVSADRQDREPDRAVL